LEIAHGAIADFNKLYGATGQTMELQMARQNRDDEFDPVFLIVM